MVFFFLSSNPMFWVNKGPTRVQILLGSDGWKQNSKTSKSLGKTNKKCPPNCNSYFVVTRIKQIQTLQQKKKEKRKKHNTATCCVKLPCKTQINLVLEQQLNLVITQHKTKLKFWQFKKIYSLPTHKNSSPSLVKQKSHKICKKTCISVHKKIIVSMENKSWNHKSLEITSTWIYTQSMKSLEPCSHDSKLVYY